MVNGKKIRQLREERGVTLEYVAKLVGLSQNMLTYVETGLRQPSVESLERIAGFFEVKVDDLLISTA